MRTLCLYVCLSSFLFFTRTSYGDGLRVRHVEGGQSVALEIGDEYWFQSLGSQLIVLEKQGGSVVTTLNLTQYTGEAFCSDLLIAEEHLYALLEGYAVLTIDISIPRSPNVIETRLSTSLGIIPHDLMMVGSTPFVVGTGGAVRLVDGQQLVQCFGEVTGIANSVELGLVYAVNRRVFAAKTDAFISSATHLFHLDTQANAKSGTLVYTRELKGKGETEIGLMLPSLRDIDATHGNITLQGNVEQVLVHGSRVLVATDKGVYVLGIAPKELRLLTTLQIEGVHDLGVIASNYLAVCGNFGYGVFRIKSDRGGEGGTLLRVVASTGLLSPGKYDRIGVTVKEASGSLFYKFGTSVEHFDTPCQTVTVPMRAVVLGWEASIEEQTGEAIIKGADGTSFQLHLPTRVRTVVAISGHFWFGTEDGVYVYGTDKDNQLVELGSIQLAGPIIQIIPQFDGSAAFISECGFVGVVESTL